MTNAHETQCKIERQNEDSKLHIYEQKTQQTETQLINVSE